MSGLFNQASLVLVPSGYKEGKVYSEVPTSGDGDLTFTRASDATRVNSDGLIEIPRTNFIRNSSMVGAVEGTPGALPSTSWSSFTAGLTQTIIDTGIENGLPYIDIRFNGTASAAGALIGLEQANFIAASVGQSWTESVYCKVIVAPSNANSFALLVYERNSSAVYIGEGSTIIVPTSDLQRFTFSRTVSGATAAFIQPYIRANLTNGATYDFTIRIAAPQMELSSVASDWIATTTSARTTFAGITQDGTSAPNVPRLDYSQGSCPALLLEPQRTNLALYSEQFDNASWTKIRASVTANSEISPDGYTNADTITADGTSGLHAIQTNNISYTSGVVCSFSVFAKKGTNSFIQLISAPTIGGMFANFDLNNGVVGTLGAQTGTNPTSLIEDFGNGWYRCTMTFTPTAASGQVASIALMTSASDTRAQSNTLTTSVYLWGAQLEQGAYATSYIPTTNATVTRLADSCSKTGISSLIGQTEGTMFLEFEYSNADIAAAQLFSLSDGTSSNRIMIGTIFSTQLSASISLAGSTQFSANTSFALVVGQKYKAALAYKANDFAFFVDGVQIAVSASGSVPATSAIQNNSGSGASQMFYNINQALLFPTRLSNSELQSLTTL